MPADKEDFLPYIISETKLVSYDMEALQAGLRIFNSLSKNLMENDLRIVREFSHKILEQDFSEFFKLRAENISHDQTAILMNKMRQTRNRLTDILQSLLDILPGVSQRASYYETESNKFGNTDITDKVNKIINDVNALLSVLRRDSDFWNIPPFLKGYIPEPMKGPLQTDIREDVMISLPGEALQLPAEQAALVKYLKTQLEMSNALLSSSNAPRETISAFAETRELLENWTDINVLALGTHLELLKILHAPLRDELDDANYARLSGFILGAIRLVSNSPTWIEFELNANRRSTPTAQDARISDQITQTAKVLGSENAKDNVELVVVRRLEDVNALLRSAPREKKGIAAAITSITDIMISTAQYSLKFIEKDDTISRKMRLMLRVLCQMQPYLMAMSKMIHELQWFSAFDRDLKAVCEHAFPKGN